MFSIDVVSLEVATVVSLSANDTMILISGYSQWDSRSDTAAILLTGCVGLFNATRTGSRTSWFCNPNGRAIIDAAPTLYITTPRNTPNSKTPKLTIAVVQRFE